ncbi:hypothetical protein L3X38_034868 [Prunus dulcis]|uniref:Uncharacterized protein n=1 Tax=Prunus dulcis TaxID=3755 RepID=A0AAD4YY99_PRUDU|nr:hypothetical protein L3X38_034868 [Prunus dulcis]
MRKQILEAPSLSFSSNLHCLILKDVKIVDESIRSAKVLTITAETIEAFKEGSMAAPRLDNICKLKARTRNLDDDLVPALVSLLRGMPNLKILYISTNPFYRKNVC